ncbi:MAG: MOSC domain-containing protein [bacterium]|nr:MOSC domain-containing protein [bacterium]
MEHQTAATLISIVYKPQGVESHPEDRYARVPLERANLRLGKGIEGDQNGKHPTRQINIMSTQTLAALQAEGFKTGPGQMGEQMIVEGLDIDALPEKTRLQLGEQAVVEIVKPRTGCQRFEQIQGQSPKQAANRMGMLAKVVIEGEVRVGDAVRVVAPVTEAEEAPSV